MPDCQLQQENQDREHVTLDRKAVILQENFRHYFGMAMDHHTKAATTSNIVLVIVGLIMGLVGFDKTIGGGVDFAAGLGLVVIGLFGMTWAWKQNERYYYWQHIAYEYQNELVKLMPDLKTAAEDGEYAKAAHHASAKKFWPVFSWTIQDRYLWVSLHSVVVIIGIVLMVVSVSGVFLLE